MRAAAALLTGGNVEALAGLMGQAGKIPVFTGAGTMALADASDFETDLSGIEGAIDTLGLNVADLSSELEASNLNIDLLFDGLNDAETQIAANADAINSSNQAISTNADAIVDLESDKLDKPTGTLEQFLRGNGSPQSVVGTVTQAAGGAIMQRGSNANGEFVRYADGTQICWKSEFVEIGVDQSFGSAFMSDSITRTFSATFSSDPAFAVSHAVSFAFNVSASTSNGVFRLGSFIARPTSSVRLSFMAIGRWF